jgi:hypothetical protein
MNIYRLKFSYFLFKIANYNLNLRFALLYIAECISCGFRLSLGAKMMTRFVVEQLVQRKPKYCQIKYEKSTVTPYQIEFINLKRKFQPFGAGDIGPKKLKF